MIDCFLSLGSNMGNKLINIQKAIRLIESSSKNIFLLKSPIYESKALYNTQLDNFYNTVIKMKTSFSPQDLLLFTQNIEKQLGRTQGVEKYSARPIDIDILSYGDKIINSKELIIPHPHIKERMFVLKPWTDIDSNYVLAQSNKKISELLKESSDNSKLSIIEK